MDKIINYMCTENNPVLPFMSYTDWLSLYCNINKTMDFRYNAGYSFVMANSIKPTISIRPNYLFSKNHDNHDSLGTAVVNIDTACSATHLSYLGYDDFALSYLGYGELSKVKHLDPVIDLSINKDRKSDSFGKYRTDFFEICNPPSTNIDHQTDMVVNSTRKLNNIFIITGKPSDGVKPTPIVIAPYGFKIIETPVETMYVQYLIKVVIRTSLVEELIHIGEVAHPIDVRRGRR